MILRCSHKFAQKIRETPKIVVNHSQDTFVDWSVHLFRFNRTQYLLITNSSTLFSIVILGRGVTDLTSFISKWSEQIKDLYEYYDLADIYTDQVAPSLDSVRLSKVGNRSITGSMNDLCKQAQCLLSFNDLSLFDLTLRLNKTPMGALDMDYPIERYRSQLIRTLPTNREP